jgi:hypothetical protein
MMNLLFFQPLPLLFQPRDNDRIRHAVFIQIDHVIRAPVVALGGFVHDLQHLLFRRTASPHLAQLIHIVFPCVDPRQRTDSDHRDCSGCDYSFLHVRHAGLTFSPSTLPTATLETKNESVIVGGGAPRDGTTNVFRANTSRTVCGTAEVSGIKEVKQDFSG